MRSAGLANTVPISQGKALTAKPLPRDIGSVKRA
jgi:hypothetical protein